MDKPKFKKKDPFLELSDRIRRLNIRHEALLIKNIERIEKERKAQLERMEFSIKAAEDRAKSNQNRNESSRLKRTNKHSTYTDEVTYYNFLDEKSISFLDRQIEGYRKTLQLLSCKNRRWNPPILADDKTQETGFDAYFPPTSKTQRKFMKKGNNE